MSNRSFSRLFVWAAALVTLIAGCSSSASGASQLFSPRNADALTLRLVALPLGYVQAVSVDPSSDRLARLLGYPGDAAVLAQDGRTGGTYRVFVYGAPEPSALAIILRIGIEMDFFTTASGAAAWLSIRQTELTATAGPIVPFGGPGQHHVMRMQAYTAGGSTDSRVVLAFAQSNVYVEVATDSIGSGPTAADAESLASEIYRNLIGSGTTTPSA